MISDHLFEIDESDGDSAWQKKALKESAATAYGGEHAIHCILVRLND